MQIVVGVDGSDSSREALAWAVAEARQRSARVRVVMAWREPYLGGTLAMPMPVDSPAIAAAHRTLLDDAIDAVDPSGVALEPRLERGDAASVILEQSADADLLVIGHRGHGTFMGLLLGSVVLRVVSHARCPVVVVSGPWRAEEGSGAVVVGADGSPESLAAARWAGDQARERGVELRVVGAWHGPYAADWPMPADVARYAEEAAADAVKQAMAAVGDGVDARGLVIAGSPSQALLAEAADADLVVVGTRGRGGFRGLLLGSTSQQVVTHAPCSAAVIPLPTEGD